MSVLTEICEHLRWKKFVHNISRVKDFSDFSSTYLRMLSIQILINVEWNACYWYLILQLERLNKQLLIQYFENKILCPRHIAALIFDNQNPLSILRFLTTYPDISRYRSTMYLRTEWTNYACIYLVVFFRSGKNVPLSSHFIRSHSTVHIC